MSAHGADGHLVRQIAAEAAEATVRLVHPAPISEPPAEGAAQSGTLRVLVVTNMYPREGAEGRGIFVQEQVDVLRRMPGLDIDVWTFDRGGKNYLKAVPALRRELRKKRYDIVHAHFGLAGLTARLAGADPLILTVHGTDVYHPITGHVTRAVSRAADLCVAVSPLLRDALPAARGPVLPMGVDLDAFKPIDRRTARRALGLDPTGKYVLFPSDPARPEKRYDLALDLVRRLEGVELLALKGVPRDRVSLYINSANAVVLTSAYEGFGLAVPESLACDVPVLATPVGIAPLLLRGLVGAHCGAFSVDDWRRAIAPHLADAADAPFSGRSRAALVERDRMAMRTALVYSAVAGYSRTSSHSAG